MRVVFGSDHAGFEMKEALRFYLGVLQHDVRIIGLRYSGSAVVNFQLKLL
jgi:ribose 5-phosphate isomerase RpiB